MKYVLGILAIATTLLAQNTGAQNVYILPMASGLDQYLAEELTHGHVLQVVADPKAADAVLTDRLGQPFEQKMSEIYPAAPTKAEGKTDETATTHNAFRSSAARGTIFLVDARTRRVLWSDYEKPPFPSDTNLHREARRVVKKLEAGQKKPQPAS